MNSNKRKSKQLGMNHATAAGRLKKKVMFALIKEAELDNCYRCGEKIETIEELSVEHKIPWLDSDDPVGLYFDLNNIAFSHLSCNSSSSRGGKLSEIPHGTASGYNHHKCRCDACKKAKAKKQRKYRSTRAFREKNKAYQKEWNRRNPGYHAACQKRSWLKKKNNK